MDDKNKKQNEETINRLRQDALEAAKRLQALRLQEESEKAEKERQLQAAKDKINKETKKTL